MNGEQNLELRRAPVEVRVAGRKLEGYAAVFGTETRIGPFTEIVMPGAFSATPASGADVLALMDHDPRQLLGRTRSGTLTISEDQKGLAFSLDVPDTQAGRDALALATRGDLGGMSFGFLVPKGGDAWADDRRELRSVDLKEISVVSSWPAYEGTVVSARSRPPIRPRLRHVQRFLETV